MQGRVWRATAGRLVLHRGRVRQSRILEDRKVWCALPVSLARAAHSARANLLCSAFSVFAGLAAGGGASAAASTVEATANRTPPTTLPQPIQSPSIAVSRQANVADPAGALQWLRWTPGGSECATGPGPSALRAWPEPRKKTNPCAARIEPAPADLLHPLAALLERAWPPIR